MIRIYLNNTLLDLDQSITVEFNSPWFSENLVGEFSYPISGPMTPRNLALLRGKSTAEVLVDADGIFIKKCSFEYRLSEHQFSGYLKLDLGTVITKMKTKLRELITTVVTIPESEFGIGLDLHGYNQKPVGSVPVCFPVIKNKLFIEEGFAPEEEALSNYSRLNYVNFQAGGSLALDSPTVQGYHIVPQVFLTWLLKECISAVGYTGTGEFLADPEIQSWILCNNVATDWVNDDRTSYQIKIHQHLPDITFIDLLKALRKDESVGIFVDNASGTMELKRLTTAILESDTLDLVGTELAGWQYQVQESTGYKILASIDSDDLMYSANRHKSSFIVESGETEVECSFGTMLMTTEPHPIAPSGIGVGTWIIPEIRLPGNILNKDYHESVNYVEASSTQAEFKPVNETELLLLSYRGLQYGTGALTYAYATSIQQNARSETVGTRCTRFDSATGRFYTSLDQHYGFMAVARKLEASALIPVSKLPQLKLSKKIKLRFTNAARFFIIEQMRLKLPAAHGKVLASMQLYELSLRDVVAQQSVTPEFEVWVSIHLENYDSIGDQNGEKHWADVVIRVWLDAGLTQPASISNLTVYYKSTDSTGFVTDYTALMNTAETTVITHILVESFKYGYYEEIREYYGLNFTLVPDPSYNT